MAPMRRRWTRLHASGSCHGLGPSRHDRQRPGIMDCGTLLCNVSDDRYHIHGVLRPAHRLAAVLRPRVFLGTHCTQVNNTVRVWLPLYSAMKQSNPWSQHDSRSCQLSYHTNRYTSLPILPAATLPAIAAATTATSHILTDPRWTPNTETIPETSRRTSAACQRVAMSACTVRPLIAQLCGQQPTMQASGDA